MQLTQLLGKTLIKCEGKKGDDTFIFDTTEGKKFQLYHDQACCENVVIEDICGEISDLIGSPILQADEESSSQDPEGYKHEYTPESLTWTFYRFSTMKGQVVIRWLGTSNGYYSESVSFVELV